VEKIIPTCVTDNGDGTYEVAFAVGEVGDGSLAITVGRAHIQGSPFNVKSIDLSWMETTDGFKGIRRFGGAYIPMDETLSRCALDLSNRAYLIWKVDFSRPKIGDFDTELFKEFHQAFAMNAGACVHLECVYGDNNHHIAESGFKALARALRVAVELDPKTQGQAASTKGVL
jgi:imidazoleglycerol phosphate dehydratase HisB